MNLGALGLCASLSAGVAGSFNEAIAALKVGAAGLWVAALGLCTLGLPIGILEVLKEPLPHRRSVQTSLVGPALALSSHLVRQP